jgi:hypothetical protein
MFFGFGSSVGISLFIVGIRRYASIKRKQLACRKLSAIKNSDHPIA